MKKVLCAFAAAAAMFVFGSAAQAAAGKPNHAHVNHAHVNHAHVNHAHVNHAHVNHAHVNHNHAANLNVGIYGGRYYRPNYNHYHGYRPGYHYNPYYRPGYYYRPPVTWYYQNVWLMPNVRPLWHSSYGVWYYINPYTGQVYYWYYYQY